MKNLFLLLCFSVISLSVYSQRSVIDVGSSQRTPMYGLTQLDIDRDQVGAIHSGQNTLPSFLTYGVYFGDIDTNVLILGTTNSAYPGFGNLGASSPFMLGSNKLLLGIENEDATNYLYFDGPSSVGLGTTSPSAKFDVVGTTEFNGNSDVNGRLHVTAAGSEIARFESNLGSHWISMYQGATRRGILWSTGSDIKIRSEGGRFAVQTNGQNIDKLMVHTDGKVGIGIGATTPSAQVQVESPGDDGLHVKVVHQGDTSVGSAAGVTVKGQYILLDAAFTDNDLNGNRYGVYLENYIGAPSGTTGSHSGGYFYTSGRRTGSNYSLYAEEGVTYADGGNWAAYFNGAGFIASAWTISDRKVKQNISTLDGALDKVMLLKPKSYTYDREGYENMNLPKGDQMGFIAQDLQEVFPSLTRKAVSPEVTKEQAARSDRQPSEAVEFTAVNHQPLIALLTKAIQEQQEVIEDLQKRIEQLENE